MKRLVAGILILLVVAFGVGVAVYLRPSNEDEKGAKSAREPNTVMLKERGPRPAESRLRDGAKQVDDPAEALAMARKSLVRMEEEIANAKDDVERARLERKRELIERAIARLAAK